MHCKAPKLKVTNIKSVKNVASFLDFYNLKQNGLFCHNCNK